MIEVINNERITVVWEVDIEFEEEGRNGRRRGVIGGEGEEDVSFGVYEFEEIGR